MIAPLLLLPALLAGPQVPPGPASAVPGVVDVLAAVPVTVDPPHPWPWARDHAPLRTATVLVLQCDPVLARPRDVGEPVLYAGPAPVERVNPGGTSGRLVVVVPGEVDVTRVPLYFGAPELPERVDAARGEAELEAARTAGFTPFDAGLWRSVTATPTRVDGSAGLYRLAADLLLQWVPEEAERARHLQAPRLEGSLPVQ